MSKQRSRVFNFVAGSIAVTCLSCVIGADAWADKWTFSEPVEIAAQQNGVFHHIESSGRQNISVGKFGVAIVWEDNRSGKASVYLRTAKTGSQFAPGIRVSREGTEAYEPVVQEFAGSIVIGWEEDERAWLRAYSQNGVTKPMQLSERQGGQVNLTAGNSGELMAVWSEDTDKYRRIFYAGLSNDNGHLRIIKKTPLDIRPGAGDQNYPVASYHESMGTYVAMWEDRRYKNVMLFSAMGTVKNGFSVGMQVNELRAPISGLYGVASGVARGALTSFNKQVAAAWSDKRNFRFGYDVYAAFARYSGRFGENQMVQDGFAEGYEQWHPTIAGKEDALVVAWDDDRDGNSDIWLSYYSEGRWSDDIAVPGASGEGIQTHPSIAMDASGGLHLVWIHREQEGGPTSVRYLHGAANPPSK